MSLEGKTVRITTRAATYHFGELGKVTSDHQNTLERILRVAFPDGTASWFSDAEVEVTSEDGDYIMIPRSSLPEVTEKDGYVETARDSLGVQWSFGKDPAEAPSETDPAHLIAIIEYFKEHNITLNQGER